jgi:DUF1707 SHOCT-like domain
VIDTLKAAFVQGRLTKDELDARAGYALTSQTYADLAADIHRQPLPADPAIGCLADQPVMALHGGLTLDARLSSISAVT